MKTLKLLIITMMIVSAVALTKTSVSANGIDEILSNMRNATRNIKTVQARLTQEKKNRQLGGTQRYSGLIKVQRGEKQGSEKAYIKYDNGQELSVVGNSITLYQPSINQVLITSRQRIGNDKKEYSFIATPFSSIDELKARFNISHQGDEGNLAILELQPKDPNLQKSTIWVDRGSWLPVQFKVIEKTGESLFTLTQVSPNFPVKADDFKIKYPADTKVIKQ